MNAGVVRPGEGVELEPAPSVETSGAVALVGQEPWHSHMAGGGVSGADLDPEVVSHDHDLGHCPGGDLHVQGGAARC